MPDAVQHGATDERLAAWSRLVAVYQSVLHDVVRALEDDADIDSGAFSVLAYLARAEPSGRLPLSELHDLMHPRYSQPGLSRLVQRMEADGWLERRADPADRRATILVLTRAGRTRFVRANAVYASALGEHFGRHLSAAESRSLERSLDSVLRARASAGAGSRTVRTR